MRPSRFLIFLGGLSLLAIGILSWQLLSYRVPDYVKNPLSPEELQIKNLQSALKLDKPLNRATDPVIGKPQAPLSVVEFGDFQCPFCDEMATGLHALANKFPDRVKIIWKDAPNERTHPQAMNAALAGRCAAEQGAFAAYHDALFANQSNLNPTLYGQLAAELGLNGGAFDQCFSSKKWQSAIEANIAEAIALGIDGTPYVFIGTERISGQLDQKELERLITNAFTP